MEYFAFQWHITDECDQRCEHCYIFAAGKKIQLKSMSFDKIKTVLEDCKAMCRQMERLPYFYITGGDPILHKDFWNLLGLLKVDNIPFAILGNPFHLTDEVCCKLKNYGCEKYQLSIDGTRETHDMIRKKGSFDTTLEKIAVLKNAGIRAFIMTTVSKTNISEIPEIIDIVVKYKADVFAFARYCPSTFDPTTHVEPEEYRQLLEICHKKFEEYKDSDTGFSLKDHLWTLFLYEKGLYKIDDSHEPYKIYDGCNCANCHITILPSGDVFACRRLKSKVGNLFEEKIHDIFNGERMNTYREYEKFEKCSKCQLLRFCRGCPAVAYGYTGNFYAADPQCWKEV